MKFGLIGHPIKHSLSPALFKAGYNGIYPYELIESSDFEEAYSRFIEDYDGINVTAPFKEKAIEKADILSEECRSIGATNLLVKTPEGVAAYNSDYRGIRLWLSEKFKNPSSDITVLVAGMGGAGKAAAAAAKSLSFNTVLMNRTLFSPEIKPLSDFGAFFSKADIIIYNLPVRIDLLDTLTKLDLSSEKPKYILEANYRNPSFDKNLISELMKKNNKIEYTGGKTWLLYQAVAGYEIFTGERPNLTAMSDVL